jgi:hypothetical protein
MQSAPGGSSGHDGCRKGTRSPAPDLL